MKKRGEMLRKYTFEEISFDVDAGPVEQAVRVVEGSLGGFSRVLKSLKKDIQAAFSTKTVVDLDKELLVLRLAWGKLGAAIRQAAAPIAAVVVPAITQAVYGATRLVKSLGAVIASLLGVTQGTQTAAEGMQEIQTAAEGSAKAVRSLAGFDELERIDTGGADTSTSATVSVAVDTTPIELTTGPLAQAVQGLLSLLEPILSIDFMPLQESLLSVAGAIGGFATTAGQQVQWLFDQVLAPGLTWVMEELAPQILGTLSSAIGAVTSALTPLQTGLQSLFTQLQPVITFIRETVLMVLEAWQERFAAVGQVFTEKGPQIQGILENLGEAFSAAWALIQPILIAWRQDWETVFGLISEMVATVIGGIIECLYGVSEFLAGIFTSDWERAWNGLGQIAKGAVNMVIGLINSMISGAVMGINRIIEAINKINFTVPDWVPLIGGETYSFHLNTVTAPQIPYLAKGAVLPANKPFLAMVGDQHHGTNIEAPLTTIQEAVANVMQDQTGAIMAGFEASVQVQRQILEAVLGIRIGDDVIANACDRYHRKMAVVMGG